MPSSSQRHESPAEPRAGLGAVVTCLLGLAVAGAFALAASRFRASEVAPAGDGLPAVPAPAVHEIPVASGCLVTIVREAGPGIDFERIPGFELPPCPVLEWVTGPGPLPAWMCNQQAPGMSVTMLIFDFRPPFPGMGGDAGM